MLLLLRAAGCRRPAAPASATAAAWLRGVAHRRPPAASRRRAALPGLPVVSRAQQVVWGAAVRGAAAPLPRRSRLGGGGGGGGGPRLRGFFLAKKWGVLRREAAFPSGDAGDQTGRWQARGLGMSPCEAVCKMMASVIFISEAANIQ